MSVSWAGWGARAVRAAARLLPADLRLEYGDEMLGVFTDRLRSVVSEHGRVSGALYVIRTVVDMLIEAVASRTTLTGEVLLSWRLQGLGQELRHAVRSLSRAWGFTVAVVSVLG